MKLDTAFKRRSLRSVPRSAAAWSIAVISLMLLVGRVTPALGQDLGQNRFDKSVEQGQTPMDELDLSSLQVGQFFVPPEKKRFPFFDDSKISAQLRTFYFYRDQFNNSHSTALTIGGYVAYKSGYLFDRLAVGAAVYTSQPLYAPDCCDGTLLLQPGQKGYTVLGQIYGELKITDRIFAAYGRREYNTPYINKNDVRMTPNTFQGGIVYGRAGGKEGGKDGVPEVRFGASYISKIKERNSEDFVSMSVDAGAGVERGVGLAGANVEWKGISFGAIDYYSDDIINIFYTEAIYALPLDKGLTLRVSAQDSDQRATGSDLLTGTYFSTNQYGLKTDLGFGAAILTAAYTDTANGANMQNPWSGYPGYTSVQVQDFNRAGESAFMLRGAYDFSSHGLKGFSSYALWVHGFGVEAPNFDQDEVDLNLQWSPSKEGPLRGMSFRARYARVMQRGGGDPTLNDVRFIMNYDFPRS